MENQKGIAEKVIQIKRVSKKNSGGNRISFTALVVVGDRNGKIGYALGKAPNVNDAIQKAIEKAKNAMFKFNLVNGTIPHDITLKQGAAKILMKPAPDGAGVIAGGAVRQVLEIAGVKNASAKILGTGNKNANVRLTIKMLSLLKK